MELLGMEVLGLVKRLILPPDIFFLIGLGGVLLLPKGGKAGLRILLFGLFGLYATSTPLVGETGLRLVDGMITPPAGHPVPQAIVVLGGTFKPGDPPDVGALTLERLRAGASLHRKTGLPLLMTAGPVDPVTVPGAEIMRAVMRDDFRVPVKWVEKRSRSTWENAVYSGRILASAGIHTVYVVTNRWHLARAQLSFRKQGITPVPIPADPPTPPPSGLESILPSVSGIRDTYFAAHELVGMLWYSLVH
jgi:uncharacterized SAM-binding protein YcdF (DUF218 family)